MKNIITRANAKITVGNAAALLAASYFASAILGLLRDRLLAAQFGIGGTLDAYFAAFSMPDLMFYLLVSGALSVTFIPVFTERLVHHNKKSAWELASSIFNLLGVITLIGSVLIFVFADQLIYVVAPAFDQARHDTAVELTRIIALNPFLFSLSTVFASMQQTFGRFFFYALAPVIYNLGIIFGIVVLTPIYGITGVAVGVLAGAGLQLVVQSLGLVGLGFKYEPKIFWKNKGFRKVLILIVPRSLNEGIVYLTAVVERAIASGLAVGSITAYQYGFNIKNVPIALIGTAIATAVFPTISHQAASSNTSGLKSQMRKTVEALLWMVIPVAALTLILRGYIVRLVLGFGDPTTAAVLGWFAVAIIFQSLIRSVSRIFYAYQDTKTPLLVSLATITLNVILAIVLVKHFEVKGLAMAQSAVAAFEATALLILLRKYNAFFINKKLFVHIIKIVIGTIFMTAVTYVGVSRILPLFAGDQGFWILAPKFLAVCLLAGMSYLGISLLLKLPEARMVTSRVHKAIFRADKF